MKRFIKQNIFNIAAMAVLVSMGSLMSAPCFADPPSSLEAHLACQRYIDLERSRHIMGLSTFRTFVRRHGTALVGTAITAGGTYLSLRILGIAARGASLSEDVISILVRISIGSAGVFALQGAAIPFLISGENHSSLYPLLQEGNVDTFIAEMGSHSTDACILLETPQAAAMVRNINTVWQELHASELGTSNPAVSNSTGAPDRSVAGTGPRPQTSQGSSGTGGAAQ